MYNLADQSYKNRPALMDLGTVGQMVYRLNTHLMGSRERRDLTILAHGGEPLLQRPEFFTRMYSWLNFLVAPGTRSGKISYRVQTNATRLSESYLDVFARYGVEVGISLDGGRQANDLHRLTRGGKSSYERTREGLQLITSPAYRKLFSGMLAVIDIRNDPVEVYKELRGYEPPVIDFLLPDNNWTHPPIRKTSSEEDTSYGDWLIAVYKQWQSDILQHGQSPESHRPPPVVRTFRTIIAALLGDAVEHESLGGVYRRPGNMVVDSDGTMHLVDALKSTREGLTDLGLSLWNSTGTLANAERLLPYRVQSLGMHAISPVCQKCDVFNVCGAGYVPHRYREASPEPFNHPTIYHADLYKLIHYISDQILVDGSRAGPPSATGA